MAPQQLSLVVPPASAVAHAAVKFPDDPAARFRFRAHSEPCCFYIDVRVEEGALPRSYLVLAWPEAGGGSRLAFPRDLGGAASIINAACAIGLIVATWSALGFLSLLLALPAALLLRVAAESNGADAEQAEVFAALAAAFEPLRRGRSPYRTLPDAA